MASTTKSFLYSLCLAAAGGLIFSLISVPIPWLLGPMAATLIGARFKKYKVVWPVYIRDAGLIVVGYSLGLSFSRESVIQIGAQLPSMLLLTVLLVLFCALMAWLVSKITGIDYPTILTGSIPGGLSQMLILAEEMKGINITVVAFLQVSRLIMLVVIVPLLIFSPIFGGHRDALAQHAVPFQHIEVSHALMFLMVAVLCAFLAKKAKLPTPFLLGPMTGTAVLVLLGFKGIQLPGGLLNVSQFMIGGYVGLLLKPEKLEKKVKFTLISLLSGTVLLCGSFGFSLLLSSLHHLDPATSYLSVAPGGMDQMGIMAHEVKADLSIVTGYQLFRLFFIYFIIPPMLKMLFKLMRRQKQIQ
ncbi:AbrB family transcriptional regulator [Peribacillus kribbensis]|uniref:AbrB family transcriptional regulator n=1 Tax=Peribacillus kribbensis TaxID=356658 RepID=UPI00041ECFFF|nr:AbrB family transcriptional regulator [Peribacillus kribbensis]